MIVVCGQGPASMSFLSTYLLYMTILTMPTKLDTDCVCIFLGTMGLNSDILLVCSTE